MCRLKNSLNTLPDHKKWHVQVVVESELQWLFLNEVLEYLSKEWQR